MVQMGYLVAEAQDGRDRTPVDRCKKVDGRRFSSNGDCGLHGACRWQPDGGHVCFYYAV